MCHEYRERPNFADVARGIRANEKQDQDPCRAPFKSGGTGVVYPEELLGLEKLRAVVS